MGHGDRHPQPHSLSGSLAHGPLRYVDPLIGTAELGNTFPAVCLPFGLAKWTPQTVAGEQKGVPPYNYEHRRMQGIRWTNFVSGSAVPDYGSMTVMALAGDLRLQPEERASRFSHRTEVATPYSYAVTFDDYAIRTEVTATERTGYFRFTFPPTDAAWLVIQPNNTPRAAHTPGNASIHVIPERNEIVGFNPAFRYYMRTGEPAGFSGHFVARFDRPFDAYGVWDGDGVRHGARKATGQPGAFVRLATGAGTTVELKVGCSFTGEQGARRNLDAESPGWSFDAVRDACHHAWQEALRRIDVEGDDEGVKTTFYTALYHALLLPRLADDVDGSHVAFAGTQLVTTPGVPYYDDFSMWDTYRAEHPLLLLVQPERVTSMIASLLDKAEHGGWLPIFPAWNNYTNEMIGDHCSSMIVDAYVKGFRGFDAERAYHFMRQNAMEIPAQSDWEDGKGRRGLASYLQHGYIPLDDPVPDAFHQGAQVSRTLEYAYDDFCVGEFARRLGKGDDAAILFERARNYRHVYDPQVGFVRGRYADGSWVAPFDPANFYPWLTEATPWIYTFHAPHDMVGLIELLGGAATFVHKLDTFFYQKHYKHDNEPSHNHAFLYAYAQAPWKTQARVRRVLRSEYLPEPDGLSGNDDSGQMSAWYVLAALGMYPTCPGMPIYVITSPLFPHITLHLDPSHYSGQSFTIEAHNAGERNKYIQAAELNGQAWSKPWLSHEVIQSGGRLRLELGPEPNYAWGSRPEDAPPSLSRRTR